MDISNYILLVAISVFITSNIVFFIKLCISYMKKSKRYIYMITKNLENHDVKIDDAIKYFVLKDYFETEDEKDDLHDSKKIG